MTPLVELSRIINFVAATIAMIGCIIIWRRENMPAMLAPITWLVNVLVFWLVRLLGVHTETILLNIWSGSIHLHACILIIGALVILGRKK